MSQVTTQTQPTNLEEPTQESAEVSIREILDELQGIPREYWFNLLQIMQAFRKAIKLNHSHLEEPINSEEEQQEQTQKNKAAIELLRKWREEEDEQEQQETWKILSEVLEIKE